MYHAICRECVCYSYQTTIRGGIMCYVNSKSKVMKSVATAALTPLEAALPVLSIRSKRVLREIIAVLN